jgi:hypothetical protein
VRRLLFISYGATPPFEKTGSLTIKAVYKNNLAQAVEFYLCPKYTLATCQSYLQALYWRLFYPVSPQGFVYLYNPY